MNFSSILLLQLYVYKYIYYAYIYGTKEAGDKTKKLQENIF